ncbi:glutathione S-transferase omega-1-like [Scomber scombrus]|uniref:Glutathione S-transferase omega n=1 Tax=Scomber scombrus TaxID=13677 RepID=A0AAV1N137_SCOSC
MTTEKCFAKGSVAPGPVPKDHIRLYSMRFCPFAQRARLVLNAKGIKYDTININLKDKPDWFLEKSPFGLVPTLETPAGEVVYESPITCEYLDEVYPEKRLLPSNPFGKAQQKMMLEHFSKVTPYFYKIPTGRKNGEDVSGLEAELKEKFTKLNELPRSHTGAEEVVRAHVRGPCCQNHHAQHGHLQGLLQDLR